MSSSLPWQRRTAGSARRTRRTETARAARSTPAASDSPGTNAGPRAAAPPRPETQPRRSSRLDQHVCQGTGEPRGPHDHRHRVAQQLFVQRACGRSPAPRRNSGRRIQRQIVELQSGRSSAAADGSPARTPGQVRQIAASPRRGRSTRLRPIPAATAAPRARCGTRRRSARPCPADCGARVPRDDEAVGQRASFRSGCNWTTAIEGSGRQVVRIDDLQQVLGEPRELGVDLQLDAGRQETRSPPAAARRRDRRTRTRPAPAGRRSWETSRRTPPPTSRRCCSSRL